MLSRTSIPITVTLLLSVFFQGCGLFSPLNNQKKAGSVFITKFSIDGNVPSQLRLAVKDNIDVAGVVTTAGSKHLLDKNAPAANDAPCLIIARERGVRIVGKTNLSEFAVSPSGINEHFGTPQNPLGFLHTRIPGGSSCGSAVAVAEDLADVAFGTDTAGSIRIPAACCGVVGLKTTHGLVSLAGVFPIEPDHMDTVGPMARDISGTVAGMDLLQRDFMQSYIAAVTVQPTGRAIRVGRLQFEGTDPKIDVAIDLALLKAGFRLVRLNPEISKMWAQAKADGNAVAASGVWISDRSFQNASGVSLRTKAVILTGRLNYTTRYEAALSRRAAWQAALRRAFEEVDVIALPTMQRTPYHFPSTADLGLLEAQMLQTANTVPFNFSGNPALSVPVPLRRAGFPVASLQLVGPRFSEARLLNAGRIVEETSYPHRGKIGQGTAVPPVNQPRPETTATGVPRKISKTRSHSRPITDSIARAD